MSEPEAPAPDPALQVAATEAVAKAEAAATRRRWINLGEFVAVAGLIIAGISLWMTYVDRKADLADRQADKTAETRDKSHYEVKAVITNYNELLIERDERHALGDITVTFPTALGVPPQSALAQTVPASWYEAALLKATDGGADNQSGTLPVLMTVHYWDDDTPLSTTGIFDIVWKTQGRLGRGRELKVIGFKLREPNGSQQRLDALWKPKPAG
ncbi:MAG: hypothetical protein V4459_02085 [Pseudomonadota bacterium]